MTHEQLDNLVNEGKLKKGAVAEQGISNLISSGEAWLKDAKNEQLSEASRFDLACNALHALSLAALQIAGYRPDRNRYVVFRSLECTLGISNKKRRILGNAHRIRNLVQYEGGAEITGELINATIRIAEEIGRLRKPWRFARACDSKDQQHWRPRWRSSRDFGTSRSG